MILSSNQTTICYYLLNMSGERLIPPPGRNGEQLASAPHKPGFFAESGIGTDLVIKPAIVFLKQLPPPEMARALGISQTGTPEKKQPLGVQVDQLQSPQGETRGVTGMQSPIGSVEQQFQRIQSRDQARSKVRYRAALAQLRVIQETRGAGQTGAQKGAIASRR